MHLTTALPLLESSGISALTTGILTVLPLAALVTLWVCTVISIARSDFEGGVKALGIIATFAFPIISSLVWFLAVRRRHPRPATDLR